MGLDLGLEAAGFETALALEINKDAIDTIRLNRPALALITERIETVSTREMLRTAALRKEDVCIVSGGPCCQTFSTAGKRESLADSRGGLFRHFKRVVAETRPRFFVMENVKGILSAAVRHRPLKQRGPGHPPLARDEELGSALRTICHELSDLDYFVIFGLLNCADYGTPQTRLRVVFIGSRDGEDITLPPATHASVPSNGKLPWVTLGDSIRGFEDKSPEFRQFREVQKVYLRQLRAGQNWRDLPQALQKAALGGAFDSWGGRCGFYRRLSWDKPAPTLTTCPTGQATTLCHPTKLRPLSIREYIALQQFPETWQFAGSTTQKYVQIGNAVPLGLGEAVGRMLRGTMRKTKRRGVSSEAKARRGVVVCGDPRLADRLSKRARTKLEPSRFRLDPDPIAAREWLASVGEEATA
jgi:DNA (cytosine-5)-methyltransferase 1